MSLSDGLTYYIKLTVQRSCVYIKDYDYIIIIIRCFYIVVPHNPVIHGFI